MANYDTLDFYYWVLGIAQLAQLSCCHDYFYIYIYIFYPYITLFQCDPVLNSCFPLGKPCHPANAIVHFHYSIFIFRIQIQNINIHMNMAELAEDIDYEPDVLKFKQIWNQLEQTHKSKYFKQSHEATKDKSKIQVNTRNQSKQKYRPKEPKKETILSQKVLPKNGKQNPEKVIEIVTKTQGKYENSLKNQKNNVRKQVLLATCTSPSSISQLNALKKSIQQKDYQLSLLRVSNTRHEDRIRALEQIIQQKNDRIFQLETRQRSLLSKNNHLLEGEQVFDYGKVQYQNFKNDTKRLLKMLQTTTEYQQFANLALDDNGVRFLNTVGKRLKSNIDSKQKSTLHFCSCNKDLISQCSFWVPDKVYSFSKQFVKGRKGEMTNPQLELLLYQLNKIWRERQKRIINTMNAQNARSIDQMKRKLAGKPKIQKQ